MHLDSAFLNEEVVLLKRLFFLLFPHQCVCVGRTGWAGGGGTQQEQSTLTLAMEVPPQQMI